MKKLKNMKASKKLTVLALTILVVFGGINLFWFISKGLPFYGYCSKVDKKESPFDVMYTKKIGE